MSSSGTDRAPASVGESIPPLTDGQIGRDPWGHEFHYSILGNPSDPHPTIVVWSDGPNGKLESNIGEIDERHPKGFHFKGDDIGYVSVGAHEVAAGTGAKP